MVDVCAVCRVPCHAMPLACQAPAAAKGAMGHVLVNDHLHWLLLLDRDRLGARHEPRVLPFLGVLMCLYLTKWRLPPPSRNMREQNQACKATLLRVLGT